MSDATWYVLVWIAPAEPRKDAYFVTEGPFATREAAAVAARAAQGDDRFARVMRADRAPMGHDWDEAEEIEP